MDKHFILTHGRSGSNFLANSLNKHPSLVNYGEVLGEWTKAYKIFSLYQKSGKSWADFLDTLYSSHLLFYSAQLVSAKSHLRKGERVNFKRKALIKSIGMKDFVFLLGKRGLNDYLLNRKEIKVIYLTRRNHFSRYLSLVNMQKSGLVKTETKTTVHNRYSIDIDDLLTSIRHFKEEENSGDEIVKALSAERVFEIEYEDYFSDGHSIEKTHSRLLEFLGVEDRKVASSQKKILARDPSDHVINYPEVTEALKQAGFGEYVI